MNIWLGQNASVLLKNSAVTIGNFDGVHLGHRHILQRLRDEAQARALHTVAIVFEPQPTEFFAKKFGKDLPYRLSPLRDKLKLLAQTQCVDTVWVQRFNPEFASIQPNDFIQHILLDKLGTQFLLVGDDFRFGQNRAGDFDLLAKQPEFVTENTPSILVSGSRASSTAVREALAAGRLDQATHILGHAYTLSGRVKHGAKLGRTIGCPTANIHLPPHRYALSGVFVVEATGSFGRKRGVASFGRNPTVSSKKDAKLEVHLFDFSGCLYGERMEVSFLHKLRDEQKYPDLAQLQAAIAKDMQQARSWV
ncbi:bifunctional riboflavin kinase/FAD synthetase [Neisseriaceae bacterium B1]